MDALECTGLDEQWAGTELMGPGKDDEIKHWQKDVDNCVVCCMQEMGALGAEVLKPFWMLFCFLSDCVYVVSCDCFLHVSEDAYLMFLFL